MFWRISLSLLIFSILAFFISRSVDLNKLVSIISGFDKFTLGLLLLISFLISLAKALKFYILLLNNGLKISFLQSLKVFIAGQATTPLPGGESTRSFLLKKEINGKPSLTSSAILAQAYYDLLAASFIAMILGIYFNIFEEALTLFFIGISFIGFLLSSHRLFSFLIKLLPTSKFLNKIELTFKKVQKGIRDNIFNIDTKLPNKVFLYSLLIGVLINFLGGLIVFQTAQSFSINLDFLQSIFIFALSTLITGLSITPGGLGLTEGGMLGILFLFRINFELALSLVLVFRFATLIFPTALGILTLGYFYGRDWILKERILLKNI